MSALLPGFARASSRSIPTVNTLSSSSFSESVSPSPSSLLIISSTSAILFFSSSFATRVSFAPLVYPKAVIPPARSIRLLSLSFLRLRLYSPSKSTSPFTVTIFCTLYDGLFLTNTWSYGSSTNPGSPSTMKPSFSPNVKFWLTVSDASVPLLSFIRLATSTLTSDAVSFSPPAVITKSSRVILSA